MRLAHWPLRTSHGHGRSATPARSGCRCGPRGWAGAAGAGEVDLLGESVAVLRPSPARLELARGLVELGIAARRAGRRPTPANRCARARSWRRAAARPRSPRRPRRARGRRGPAAADPERRNELTAAEQRVARMAADGRQPRDRAGAVPDREDDRGAPTCVYRKLDVPSRSSSRGPWGKASGRQSPRPPTPTSTATAATST